MQLAAAGRAHTRIYRRRRLRLRRERAGDKNESEYVVDDEKVAGKLNLSFYCSRKFRADRSGRRGSGSAEIMAKSKRTAIGFIDTMAIKAKNEFPRKQSNFMSATSSNWRASASSLLACIVNTLTQVGCASPSATYASEF